MRKFVEKIHEAGMSWVPIVDPAITVDPGFRAYKEGNADGVWMRDYKGETYVGQVSGSFGVWVVLNFVTRVC